MKKIIILTQGNNLDSIPINAKIFINLLIKHNIPFECLSQKKVKYLSNKFIIKKKGILFFISLKITALLSIFFKIKNHLSFSEILSQLFDLNDNLIFNNKKIENIKFVDSINDYLNNNIYENTIYLSFGAPIIKRNIINKINHNNSLILNSHIGTAKYPGIVPYIHAILNKDFDNIGFILHQLTDKIDQGNIYLEKHINICYIFNKLGKTFSIKDLTNILLIFSAIEIFKFLKNKNFDKNLLIKIYNNTGIEPKFLVNYLNVLKANYLLNKKIKECLKK